jgi:hypothetical protein
MTKTTPMELPRTPYALELNSEDEDDIHDRPTIPTIPVAVRKKELPKIRRVYKTPAAAFFAGCDAWEYRPMGSPSHDAALDERLAEEANALWWISERRRWLSRWVFGAAILSLAIVVVAAFLVAHGK